MKSIKFLWLFGFLTVGIFLLAACGSSPTPAVQPTEASMMTAEKDSGDMMDADENHTDGDDHAVGVVSHTEGDEHAAETSHEHISTPEEYAGKNIPFTIDDTAIAAGKAIYDVNCASCHGETGAGDGVAGTALNPKPANLADTHMMAEVGDDYLFWRISEGGMIESFNSLMPAWKQVLGEEERWQVIAYLRTLGK